MILLDTDVLIDIALDRQPHVKASGALVSYLETRPRMAFVAWHTLANLYGNYRPVAHAAFADVAPVRFKVTSGA